MNGNATHAFLHGRQLDAYPFQLYHSNITVGKDLHDRIILIRGEIWAHILIASLTQPLIYLNVFPELVE